MKNSPSIKRRLSLTAAAHSCEHEQLYNCVWAPQTRARDREAEVEVKAEVEI